MKRNWIIIVLTGLFLLIAGLLVVHLHSLSKRAVLFRFQQHQLLHAHHFAEQIESFFWGHTQGLLTLSSFLSSRGESINGMKAEIEAYSRQIPKEYIREISLSDELGRIIYSTDVSAVGSNCSQRDFFFWAKNKGKRGEVFLSPFPMGGNALLFHLSIPFYQGSAAPNDSQKGETFAGVISLKLDLKGFLTDELKKEKVGLNQLWIMDKGGSVLFHSEHPEMTLRSIYQRDKSCNTCHVSFARTERILKEKEGTVDYEVKNSPKKLAAFSTVQFGNASWAVVVNFPYNQATAFATKSLREHLILLGLVAFALIASSTLILRNSQLKLRAEEEARRWQERVAERKKAEEAIYLERNKLKSILDNMQEGVSIIGQDCDIQYTNPMIEKEFGPINGRKCHEYFHGMPEVCSWCKNEEVFSGKPVRWEFYLPKTGKTYEIFETPMNGADGGVSILEVFHDITGPKRTEETLKELERQRRHLSFQLLSAQETERRRVSRELHDELGGALAVFKLRLSYIEKHLQEEQRDLKKECGNNMQYIDQVIENVRRLSRDLSPSILEDLGLSSALRWLTSNFGKNYNIEIGSDIAEIDHLFPQDTQIVVYRIVQEALTNIGKHAQAQSVSLRVEKDDGVISFSVEDDGKGFDVRRAMLKDAGERGLGLPSMDERARMLGGSLEVWSKEGKGTRITVRIPIEKKGIL